MSAWMKPKTVNSPSHLHSRRGKTEEDKTSLCTVLLISNIPTISKGNTVKTARCIRVFWLMPACKMQEGETTFILRFKWKCQLKVCITWWLCWIMIHAFHISRITTWVLNIMFYVLWSFIFIIPVVQKVPLCFGLTWHKIYLEIHPSGGTWKTKKTHDIWHAFGHKTSIQRLENVTIYLNLWCGLR